ncbi:sugar ABC transporter substrate-binding protein [Nocardioides zeae]|uniref:Sugar ABC transporter substrate-binding protein n=1 Tax=Nocardioides imazamoxiresistens TaxID=3231893 RepID=A0ABU3PTV3_9ACTN|nr:sugar ABC transporter substrate-binding protein [Nocardioides zeae]MDT9592272.1 sugar ABC transporter substrate-binding protein [Nocardioides zeae]
MALGLAACGEVDGAEQSSGGSSEDLTIGVSNLGLSFPFPSAIGEGIKARADELGVTIVELDAQSDTEKQSNDVQDLIGQAPDGVLLLPVDSGVAVGLVDQLASADIPTVAVASQVGDPSERDLEDVYEELVALVTQDELAAGRAAGELALQALPEGGKLAVVEGAAGFAEVELRFAEFLDPAEEAGVEFEVVARQPGDWTVEGAQGACQNLLASDPDIDVLYAESDDMAVGCAEAVDAAGSDAVVIGIGGSQLGIDGVEAGDVYGTVCFKPRDLGELAMQVIYDHLTGEETRESEFVSYDTPAVTADNVDECDPQW